MMIITAFFIAINLAAIQISITGLYRNNRQIQKYMTCKCRNGGS